MGENESDMTRRSVLRASGATILAGGTLVSTAAAGDDLVSVDPTEIELSDCGADTGTVTVGLAGPPFGRTDVDVTADDTGASPRSFRLGGRGDSETVTVGPGAGTVTVTATTPRGDGQTETVEVTCGEPEFDVTIGNDDPIELWSITGTPDPQTIEVTVENVGDGPGEREVEIDNVADERWMEPWGYRGETERSVELDPGESAEIAFELEWNDVTTPDERYGWDVVVETEDDSDSVRIEMRGL